MKRKLYLIENIDSGYIKIGISVDSEKRLKTLQTGNSSSLKLLKEFDVEFASKIERALHLEYSTNRLAGEWFNISIDLDVNTI